MAGEKSWPLIKRIMGSTSDIGTACGAAVEAIETVAAEMVQQGRAAALMELVNKQHLLAEHEWSVLVETVEEWLDEVDDEQA